MSQIRYILTTLAILNCEWQLEANNTLEQTQQMQEPTEQTQTQKRRQDRFKEWARTKKQKVATKWDAFTKGATEKIQAVGEHLAHHTQKKFSQKVEDICALPTDEKRAWLSSKLASSTNRKILIKVLAKFRQETEDEATAEINGLIKEHIGVTDLDIKTCKSKEIRALINDKEKLSDEKIEEFFNYIKTEIGVDAAQSAIDDEELSDSL